MHSKWKLVLRKKNPYSVLFWSAFFPHSDGIRRDSVRMWENAGKMRTRITPNTDSFYGVSHTYLRLKDALKGLIHFLTTESPLQMMENVFHLKMSFHFQDI